MTVKSSRRQLFSFSYSSINPSLWAATVTTLFCLSSVSQVASMPFSSFVRLRVGRLFASHCLPSIPIPCRDLRWTPSTIACFPPTSALSMIQTDEDETAIIKQPLTYDEKYAQLMSASKLSLAPMMEYTDRHFRHLVRLISSRTLLYTEMVAANALCHEQRRAKGNLLDTDSDTTSTQPSSASKDSYLHRFLGQGPTERGHGSSVLQLGGSDPQQMFEAAQAVITSPELCDYTALNLNCGCPSPKVAGKGCFGAALMNEPALVAELTQAMYEGAQRQLPVTVKCRIGTDVMEPFHRLTYGQNDEAEYERLCRFIETVSAKGIVTDFVVHARIAVIRKSFSPADNRSVPPLKYQVVRRLVQEFPHLTFSLNGGITTLPQVQEELAVAPDLNGVMVGRAWAADPWSFAMADHLLYQEAPPEPTKNRWQILEAYSRYADAEEERGQPQNIRRFIIKAISPLFAGEKNAKRFRIALDDISRIPKTLKSQGKSLLGQPPLSEQIMNAALQHLSQETLFRTPEESYERICRIQKSMSGDGRSASIDEWQELRKGEADSVGGTYEERVAEGMG
jgi:tRNA-dihydrouridine synthase A